jgi:hypothetical protein
LSNLAKEAMISIFSVSRIMKYWRTIDDNVISPPKLFPLGLDNLFHFCTGLVAIHYLDLRREKLPKPSIFQRFFEQKNSQISTDPKNSSIGDDCEFSNLWILDMLLLESFRVKAINYYYLKISIKINKFTSLYFTNIISNSNDKFNSKNFQIFYLRFFLLLDKNLYRRLTMLSVRPGSKRAILLHLPFPNLATPSKIF